MLRRRRCVAYRREGLRWEFDQLLVPSDDPEDAELGSSVAVSGNVIAVGADRDDGDRGTVYVYRYEVDEWIEEQKIVVDGAGPYDNLGYDVDVEGDVLVASAPGEDAYARDWGGIHVFTYEGDDWVEEDALVAPDHSYGAPLKLGQLVSISGDRVVASSYNERRAYVYGFDGASRSHAQTIASPGDAPDIFTYSLWLEGETRVSGDAFSGPLGGEGSVWVFEFDGAEFIADRQIQAWDRYPAENCGFRIAVSGDRIAISAPYESREPLWRPGAVYVFEFRPAQADRPGDLTPIPGPSATTQLEGPIPQVGRNALIGCTVANMPALMGTAYRVLDARRRIVNEAQTGALRIDALPRIREGRRA